MSDFTLRVSALTESKAKLLLVTRKNIYIRGERFRIDFTIANVTEKEFPGGRFGAEVRFPTQQVTEVSFNVPRLAPRDAVVVREVEDVEAYAEGTALVYADYMTMSPQIADSIHPDHAPVTVEFVTDNRQVGTSVGGAVIGTRSAIHSIHIELRRDYYTYYAFLIAAVSLSILAVDRVLSLLYRLIP